MVFQKGVALGDPVIVTKQDISIDPANIFAFCGEAGERDGGGEGLGGEVGEDCFDGGFVFGDEVAFHVAFLGAAEDVQPCAAEEAEVLDDAEGGEHPGAVGFLDELAGVGVAPGQERGREAALLDALSLVWRHRRKAASRIRPTKTDGS